MSLTKSQAQSALKKATGEVFNLTGSCVIHLFEVDVSNLIFDQDIVTSLDTVFRFHNNIKLTNNTIFFKGLSYIAAPIEASGFEMNGRGTTATPTISISVSPQGIPMLASLKEQIYNLGDLTGAKLIRITTLAKYLDAANFLDQITPSDFDPDNQVEFPRDIYYFERKSNESRSSLQYELSSSFDTQGIKLPARICLATKCPFQYRGAGCRYEASSRRNLKIHSPEGPLATLPASAPAVANNRDELITEILSIAGVADKGRFSTSSTYNKGDSVFITKGGINYYFVAKSDSPLVGPPNARYWVSDQCSKLLSGCKIRWGTNGSVDVTNSTLVKGQLMFGGFPSVNKLTG